MVGKIKHWKHGWIPITDMEHATRTRKAEAERNAPGIKPLGKKGGTIETLKAAPDVRIVHRPGESYTLTLAESIEAAKVIQMVYDAWPGLKSKPLRLGGAKSDDWWAETATFGNHEMTVNGDLWSEKAQEQLNEWQSNSFAIAGEANNVSQFRRYTILHELGHVIMDRSEDDAQIERKSVLGVIPSSIDQFATETVTPRQMGFIHIGKQDDDDSLSDNQLDMPVPRWTADTLHWHTQYGTSSPMEWFAEAFTEGFVNGGNASESGKRAIALVDELYGPNAKGSQS